MKKFDRSVSNLCVLTYATKSGVRKHVKNVLGPTPTSEFDTNSSTKNDGYSDDSDADENNTDEDSETLSNEEDQMKTSTPVPYEA